MVIYNTCIDEIRRYGYWDQKGASKNSLLSYALSWGEMNVFAYRTIKF